MVCEGIDDELLTRFVCDSGFKIVLISRILVSTVECTTLTYTSGSCYVLVCLVSSNSVLLVPSHTNISRVAGRGMDIFIERLRTDCDSVEWSLASV